LKPANDEGVEPRPVVAERRRDDVEEDAAESPEREERHERLRGSSTPGEEDADNADDHDAEEVLPVERVDALVRLEDDERRSLHSSRDDEACREPDASA